MMMYQLLYFWVSITLPPIFAINSASNKQSTIDLAYTIEIEECLATTVTRCANTPDQFFDQNDLLGSNESSSSCTTRCDSEQQCQCTTTNQTYFVSKTSCSSILAECTYCLDGDDLQIALIDLHSNTKLSNYMVHRCSSIPLPPVFFLFGAETNRGQEGDCQITSIDYDGGSLNGEMSWQTLNTRKSRLPFYMMNKRLEWSGSICELNALSGLVLKLHLQCASNSGCLAIKTQGKKTFKHNHPEQIQSDFDKCQEPPTPSTQTEKAKTNVNSKPTPTTTRSRTTTTATTTEAAATTTTTTPVKASVLATPTFPTPARSVHASTPKLASNITPPIATLPVLHTATLDEATRRFHTRSLSPSLLVPTLSSTLKIVSSISTKLINMTYEYPDIQTEGNNDLVITAAGVTVGICLVMILVTMVIITKRNKRESKEDDSYTNSDFSVYDDRSHSESILETVRKRYVVEKFGAFDHNLNQPYIVPSERRKESILKNALVGNDGNNISTRCRSITRMSVLSVTSNVVPNVVVLPNRNAEMIVSANKHPPHSGVMANKNAQKRMCDCSTYTEHDIPSLLTSIPEELNLQSTGASFRRRSTWHVLDRRKQKEYSVKNGKKDSVKLSSKDLPDLIKYRAKTLDNDVDTQRAPDLLEHRVETQNNDALRTPSSIEYGVETQNDDAPMTKYSVEISGYPIVQETSLNAAPATPAEVIETSEEENDPVATRSDVEDISSKQTDTDLPEQRDG